MAHMTVEVVWYTLSSLHLLHITIACWIVGSNPFMILPRSCREQAGTVSNMSQVTD